MDILYVRLLDPQTGETIGVEEFLRGTDTYEESVRIATLPSIGVDRELITKEEYDELKASR